MPSSDQRDLVTRAYETLQAQIVNGRLAPGSRIIESDLAERLGVSRTPVRSALQRLQQEGYVQALDGGRNLRLIVAPLTRADCEEVLNLQGAVEGLAARWAARLPEGERRTLARELERQNDRLAGELGADAPDPQQVFRAHYGFHTTAVERLHSPRLDAALAVILPQTERYRRVYITTAPHGFEGEVEEHRAIIAAISEGDADEAQLAVQRNWERAAERLGRTVERLGERGTW
jgi:DNA-binding GntR family transcriptional regulator